MRRLLRRGLEQTASLWPPVRATYRWVKRVARLLENKAKQPARQVRRGMSALLSKMRQAAAQAQDPAVAEQLRWFVKVWAIVIKVKGTVMSAFGSARGRL